MRKKIIKILNINVHQRYFIKYSINILLYLKLKIRLNNNFCSYALNYLKYIHIVHKILRIS